MTDKIKSIGIILDYLEVHGSATSVELRDRLEQGGMASSDRTFERLKTEMRDSFGLELIYEDNQYSLKKNPNPSQEWLLKMIEAIREVDFYKLALDDPKFQNRILFDEAGKPAFYQHLAPIFKAIVESVTVTFTYHFFEGDRYIPIDLKPYLLKKFQNRWYVVGYSDYKDDVRNYGLDRISDLSVTSEKFKATDIDQVIKNYDSIVGLNYTNQPIRLVLRAFSLQQHYLKELPLHHTQKEIGKGDNWTDYEYHLRPNYELELELLRLSDQVVILEPATLKEKLLHRIKSAIELISQHS